MGNELATELEWLMGVEWSDSQRIRVSGLIEEHPVTTSDCAVLGRKVLPIGRERDAAAHGLVVRANTTQTRFACLKPRHGQVKRRWFHHVTVAVDEHGVDALAGVDGTPLASYLREHFIVNHANDLWLDHSDPDLEDPLL